MKPEYECVHFTIKECEDCAGGEKPAYTILDRKAEVPIAAIKWHEGLSEYLLIPRRGAMFNWDCLFHVLNFLSDLLKKQIIENESRAGAR